MLLGRRTRLLLPLAALCGCSGEVDDPPTPGGQTGEESGAPGCVQPAEVSSQTLAAGEVSPLGFSAEQLLTAIGTERRQTLTWPDGTSTPVRLGLVPSDADVTFERVLEHDPCADIAAGGRLKVPVRFTLATEDGALNETWPLTLTPLSQSMASGYHSVDLETLPARFRVERVNGETPDDVSAYISVELSATTWTGSLRSVGVRLFESAEEHVVWAEGHSATF
jgi:hypothetical protein